MFLSEIEKDTRTHTEMKAREDGGRDWSFAATNQGTREASRSRKRQEGFLASTLERVWPANTLISDFWTPELRENSFLLF